MLRVGLSPLRAHKFGHDFLDTSDDLCLLCNIKEDTEHFLLSCRSYILSRSTLLQKVSDTLGYNVSSIPKSRMVNILLFGKEGIPDSKNYLILSFVVDYIIKSKRLDTLGEGGGISLVLTSLPLFYIFSCCPWSGIRIVIQPWVYVLFQLMILYTWKK